MGELLQIEVYCMYIVQKKLNICSMFLSINLTYNITSYRII